MLLDLNIRLMKYLLVFHQCGMHALYRLNFNSTVGRKGRAYE